MLTSGSRGQGQISPFGVHTEGLTRVSHLGSHPQIHPKRF